MRRFRIDAEYHLPVYRRRFYDAATIEDACRMAISDEGWDDEQSDVDSSGDTYVADIREDDLVAMLREPAREMGLSKRDFEDWLPRAQAVLSKADAIGT